jgi:hypothetical protein
MLQIFGKFIGSLSVPFCFAGQVAEQPRGDLKKKLLKNLTPEVPSGKPNVTQVNH